VVEGVGEAGGDVEVALVLVEVVVIGATHAIAQIVPDARLQPGSTQPEGDGLRGGWHLGEGEGEEEEERGEEVWKHAGLV